VTQILFRAASVLDVTAGVLLEGNEVLVEGDRIKEVSDRPIRAASDAVVQLHGRVLMPGLIDAHIHIYLSELNLTLMADMPASYVVARSGPTMRAMLERGFTSVRDNGGADWAFGRRSTQGSLPARGCLLPVA
jgi:imidazolonepropionase-like amidohydrolase